MALSSEIMVWIRENVAQLKNDCEDKKDALQYVPNLVDECIEEKNLTISVRSLIEKAIITEIGSIFEVAVDITAEEWEQFFDLMTKIVDGNGPVSEKKELVEKQAEEFSRDMQLEEFTAWWA